MTGFDFTVTDIEFIVKRDGNKDWSYTSVASYTNYVIVLSMGGEAMYKTGDQFFITQPNTVYMFPPHNRRTGKSIPDNPWKYVSIAFTLEWHSGDPALFHKQLAEIGEVGEEVQKEFCEMYRIWSQKHSLWPVRCRAVLQKVLCDLLIAQNHKDGFLDTKRLQNAKNYIREHFSEKIDFEKLSREYYMSISHFRKLYKEEFQQSPKQYQTGLRLDKANDLLLSGEFNVTEVASMCGFSDVFYFSKVFKQKTGLSPNEVRRSNS